MDTEKITRSILRNVNDRTKPVKKSFKFNLLKLITKQTEESQKKIKNAIDNETVWDKDNIQSLSMNALQDLFFNIIDHLKVQKPGYQAGEYCIAEKHLEAILMGYFEEKEEMEKEIEDLRDNSITIKEHKSEMKELKNIIKEKNNDIKKLENKLNERDKFYKEKIECIEPRMRKQVEMEMKMKGWTPPQPSTD